ncbi:MAG: hypothetical protein WBS54_01675 [Acidobacteriota bacterium]
MLPVVGTSATGILTFTSIAAPGLGLAAPFGATAGLAIDAGALFTLPVFGTGLLVGVGFYGVGTVANMMIPEQYKDPVFDAIVGVFY